MDDERQPDIVSTPRSAWAALTGWLGGVSALPGDSRPSPWRIAGPWPARWLKGRLQALSGLAQAAGAAESLVWATAVCLTLIHAAPAVSVLAHWLEFEPRIAAGLAGLPGDYPVRLWERLAPVRAGVNWEQVAVGLLVTGLCFNAARQARVKPVSAAESLVAAAFLNTLDWLLIGPNMARSPLLNIYERNTIVVFCLTQVAVAGLLWLAVRARRA